MLRGDSSGAPTTSGVSTREVTVRTSTSSIFKNNFQQMGNLKKRIFK
jgi:hypothetical protein